MKRVNENKLSVSQIEKITNGMYLASDFDDKYIPPNKGQSLEDVLRTIPVSIVEKEEHIPNLTSRDVRNINDIFSNMYDYSVKNHLELHLYERSRDEIIYYQLNGKWYEAETNITTTTTKSVEIDGMHKKKVEVVDSNPRLKGKRLFELVKRPDLITGLIYLYFSQDEWEEMDSGHHLRGVTNVPHSSISYYTPETY